ncbi:HIT family protein [Methanolobus sediminis]|uniref:HIT family protein n=1 Tax=Methanolobus sediminis TaxID=3072978 RepID=A0AA51UKX0_9EURY|nr:HIT family protein [Methanolobus sediminis]WMW24978.1 HIT family protein [Methanolobus sediminis]
MDCLFCKIVAGEIPSHKVYEDDFVYAFLDIYPCAEGHTIVLPKKHFEKFTDMSDDEAASLFASVNKVAKTVGKTLELEGMNIGINNGELAGQTVPHVHVHIIPRRAGDGEGNMHTIVELHPSTENIAELAEKLRNSF